jgi:hypothetical protein
VSIPATGTHVVPAPEPAAEPVIAAPEPVVSELGELRVRSSLPSGIIIDGKRRGKTPKTLWLKPGTYKLTLEAPNGDTREIVRFVGRGKSVSVNVYW